eukprot:349115-Alexandrium_andersonii.AAC.1
MQELGQAELPQKDVVELESEQDSDVRPALLRIDATGTRHPAVAAPHHGVPPQPLQEALLHHALLEGPDKRIVQRSRPAAADQGLVRMHRREGEDVVDAKAPLRQGQPGH